MQKQLEATREASPLGMGDVYGGNLYLFKQSWQTPDSQSVLGPYTHEEIPHNVQVIWIIVLIKHHIRALPSSSDMVTRHSPEHKVSASLVHVLLMYIIMCLEDLDTTPQKKNGKGCQRARAKSIGLSGIKQCSMQTALTHQLATPDNQGIVLAAGNWLAASLVGSLLQTSRKWHLQGVKFPYIQQIPTAQSPSTIPVLFIWDMYYTCKQQVSFVFGGGKCSLEQSLEGFL